MRNDISIFQRPVWVVVFALTAAIAWGWAFPLIKLGFSAFGITADMTGSKMLFAGIRFAAAGGIVLAVARSSRRPFGTTKMSDWWFILAFALMNTALHYFFFYVGMSHSEGFKGCHPQLAEHVPGGAVGLCLFQERQTDFTQDSGLCHWL